CEVGEWLECRRVLFGSRQEPGKADRRAAEQVSVRVTLTGRISIEGDEATLDERRLPGRQGRLVFAYLLAEHGRPVSRDELADAQIGRASCRERVERAEA